MINILRVLALSAFWAWCGVAAAQAQNGNMGSSFGLEYGLTSTHAARGGGSLASQYLFYHRHALGDETSGELGLGVGFWNHIELRSRFIPVEYRFYHPLNDWLSLEKLPQIYVYAGLGAAWYEHLEVAVQDHPFLRQNDPTVTNTPLWNNGSGLKIQLPVGLQTYFALDAGTGLRLRGGYNLLGGSPRPAGGGFGGYWSLNIGLDFRPGRASREEIGPKDALDSDGDGLTDLAEISTYYTDPDKADTDGDGLLDGFEINDSFTDPLLVDTDGGLMPDGKEYYRHSDPLSAVDDYPAALLTALMSVSIHPDMASLAVSTLRSSLHYAVLEFRVQPEHKAILERLAGMLKADESLSLDISGYADPKGHEIMNRSLSNLRSWKVKEYFLQKGYPYNRLAGRGYGEDQNMAAGDGNTPASRVGKRRADLRFLKEKLPDSGSDSGTNRLKETYNSVISLAGQYLVPADGILFERYSDGLNEKARQWLGAAAAYLRENPHANVEIRGYASKSGSERVNRMLAEARASSVAAYLLGLGVDYDRLHLSNKYKVEQQPEGHPEVLQRRVEVHLLK